MAYATIEDIQARILRTLSPNEVSVATALADSAAVYIDAYNNLNGTDMKAGSIAG